MATTTKATDPAAELAPVEEQLQVARQERDRLGVEARAWQAEVANLERDLSDLARTDPAQFSNGFPKQRTTAAGLRGEIDKRVNGNRWGDILGGADRRIQDLEHGLSRRTEANAEALAHREYRGRGTANAEKWRRIAALILEADSEYTASTNRHLAIVTSVTGLDGQNVVSDPVVTEARELAGRLAEVQPPRSVSLVPLTSEDPTRVKSVHGGFIRAGANAGDIAEDQPDRVEPV
ncbi:MAG: hypothetical protein AABM42_10095 [Actinomycetota bacterium]